MVAGCMQKSNDIVLDTIFVLIYSQNADFLHFFCIIFIVYICIYDLYLFFLTVTNAP